MGGCLSCLSFCFAQPPQRSQLPQNRGGIEEDIPVDEAQKIGAVVTMLQRQLQERTGRWGRPSIDKAMLNCMQWAIGTLSPSEQQMRDLQFQNVEMNNRCLYKALVFLNDMAQQGGPTLITWDNNPQS